MFALPWYSIIFISIPQTILIIELGFRLFNLTLDFRKCLIVALLVGIFTFFLRSSSVVPGVHTVLLIIVITVLVTIINAGNGSHNLAAVMLGSMIMGTIEGVWCPLFLSLASHSPEDLTLYPWLNIACFIPILIISIAIYVVVKKHCFVIYNLDQKGS